MIKDFILAAEEGGKIIKKYFGDTLEIEQKTSITDFRTNADLESEQAILKILSTKFPKFNILSEEIGSINKGSAYTIVVDPLDGTNNFALGIPNFSVSIGLLEEDEIIAGVIHIPMIDKTFFAEKNKGAFCNEKKISVNAEKDLKKSTIAYACGYNTPQHFEMQFSKDLRAKSIKRFLTNWSPAYDYCLLASGKIESILTNDIELYDYSAGKIIAREAGAILTDFVGQNQNDRQTTKFIASATQQVHDEIRKAITI